MGEAGFAHAPLSAKRHMGGGRITLRAGAGIQEILWRQHAHGVVACTWCGGMHAHGVVACMHMVWWQHAHGVVACMHMHAHGVVACMHMVWWQHAHGVAACMWCGGILGPL
eukprot:365554-Chlamydomonas_euryale.AAC.22